MPAPFQGGCVCGEVRYESAVEPVKVFHCHCRDCQRSSGAGHATVALVPKAAFKTLKGSAKRWEYPTDSGNKIWRYFCGNCGAPVFAELSAAPDLWAIRVANMDDSSWVKPSLHLWGSAAPAWDPISDSLAKDATQESLGKG
jgi:hypothetical protein